MDGITWIGSPNHYQGRNGYDITHITLHIMVGYLTGTDSVFQHPKGASAHYGIGSDGTIHQYVSETDGSWSDANYASNNSTISIEHEGGMDNIPCTQACMDASAKLCADIARRHGWTHLWHDGLKGNIWFHREIPGTDHAKCPDLTPNGLDVNYVINKANQLLQGQGDDDMSAADVTTGLYQTKGNDGRNLFDGVIQTRSELKDRAMDALYQAKGNDGRNLFDGVIQTRWDIAELKTMLTAQTTAIETLSKAVGAKPDDIAKTVQEAVKAKLDTLKITVE
uniref:N-acetylmuramoyl-L-alanine amidase n=1 Tax=Bifidobacterium adolescentis TaxID=1680 RepID=UPI0040292972